MGRKNVLYVYVFFSLHTVHIMTLATGLVAHHAATPALVTAVNNRFYPLTAPQAPIYPYYLVQRVSTPNHVASHDGNSQLEQTRLQFTVVAKTVIEAGDIANAIKDAYIGFVGYMGDVWVSGVTLANDLEDYDTSVKTYRRMIDVMLWYRPNQ